MMIFHCGVPIAEPLVRNLLPYGNRLAGMTGYHGHTRDDGDLRVTMEEPRTAVIVMARGRRNAQENIVVRMMTSSAQPPRVPASAPERRRRDCEEHRDDRTLKDILVPKISC
jgi:hypothetical protein